MLYREPLISPETGTIDPLVFSLLSDAQLAWLAVQSVRLDQSVAAILQTFRPMAEQESPDAETVRLEGILPNCKMYGCLSSDGTTHT